MSIKETLKQIASIARYYKIDKPYIVGGLPRDLYLQKEVKTSDIDLTTNSPDVMRLGILIADKLNVPFELSDDGHITVFADEFDIDFSSHFVSDKVLEFLEADQKKFAEAYSRDFTINALHQDLETGEFFDPTGMAVQDIKSRLIRTPVPPEITLKDDPRRAYRAVNLAVRYDFEITTEVTDFIRENKDLFGPENIKDKYITLKINKALTQDPDKTLRLLKELELFDSVPLVGQFKEVLIEKKMLVDYLGGSKIQKEAQTQTARNWEEYVAQGPEYEKIRDFWQKKYQKFEGYNSPEFNSWAKWYMDRYRGVWNYKHKGPEEVLRLMQEEMSSGITGLSDRILDEIPDLKMPGLSFFFKKKAPTDYSDYASKVNKAKYADIQNLTTDLKSFIKVLGETAQEMGAETPYITSGYRSVEHQAQIMLNNWKANGGMNNGREYLVNLYGRRYGNEVADVFESYRGAPEAARYIMPIIQKYGGKHIENPAKAIDLRLTQGISDVLYAIQNSGRFDMKLVDERRMAGPHWHVTVYKDKGLNRRLSRLDNRKEFLGKIVANTCSKNRGQDEKNE